MDSKQVVNLIVSAIKNRRSDVVSFIKSHGGVIKKEDTNVKLGKELSRILSLSKANQEDFASLLSSSSADGATEGAVAGSAAGPYGAIIGGIMGMFSSGESAKQSAQAGSDAITLALINAGIEKQKGVNWTLIIGISIAVITLIIGFIMYKKYSK